MCDPSFWEATGGAAVVLALIAAFFVGLLWALGRVIGSPKWDEEDEELEQRRERLDRSTNARRGK